MNTHLQQVDHGDISDIYQAPTYHEWLQKLQELLLSGSIDSGQQLLLSIPLCLCQSARCKSARQRCIDQSESQLKNK